jgi:uncharacterized membrane protein YfhO
MVVVAQTYYHNWKAYVDGQPVRVWRANHAFQAIDIAAGQHLIRFVYEDTAFRIGMMISFVSLVLCVVGCFLLKQKRSAAVQS